MEDPRTEVLQAVYGIASSAGVVDAQYVTSAAELAAEATSQHLGRLVYLYADQEEGREPVTFEGRFLGYSPKSPAAGQGAFQISSSLASVPGRQLGFGYLGPQTNGNIHSAILSVSEGVNALELNLAAGGAIQSWEVSGTEILNRGNSWGRGVQSMLEWADGANGRLTIHRPSQASCRFSSGPGALGAPVLAATDYPDPLGGRHVAVTAIPLEFDPDGTQGVVGVSADHGGGVDRPVLWRQMLVTTDLWLDYRGHAGLHRLQTVWSAPFETLTGYLDCAAITALSLDTAFDEVVVRDHGAGASTDVSALVDATDFRRFSYAPSLTYEDDVTVPESAPLLSSGFGGVYGRNTGTDLTVAIAGRLHDTPEGADVFLGDVPRGTNATVLTNRTGSTGQDGAQCVVLGLDSNLSSRWCDVNQKRRIRFPLTVTRWIATGTLASVLANLSRIPASY